MDRLKKTYSMLGLATRAGKIKSGEFAAEQSVKAGKCYLCIVADDASANTKKKFNDMCSFYETPIAVFGTKEDIGHAIGKEMRATVAVCDEGFANNISKLVLSNENDNGQGTAGFTTEDEKV